MVKLTKESREKLLNSIDMNKEEFERWDRKYTSTFFDALNAGHKDAATCALLEDGFEYEYVANEYHDKPSLHCAVAYGMDVIADVLINNFNVDVNQTGYENLTPLHVAVINRASFDTILTLCRNCADVSLKDQVNGQDTKSAIDYAISNNQIALANFLKKFIGVEERARDILCSEKSVASFHQEAKLEEYIKTLYVNLQYQKPHTEQNSGWGFAGSGQAVSSMFFSSPEVDTQKDWYKYGAKWTRLLKIDNVASADDAFDLRVYAQTCFQKIANDCLSGEELHWKSMKSKFVNFINESLEVDGLEYNDFDALNHNSVQRILNAWQVHLGNEYNVDISMEPASRCTIS